MKQKRQISRRQFAKLAGAAAVTAPASSAAWSQEAARPAQQPAEEARPKLTRTPEQEERVKQAVQRGERQRAGLRNYKLSYSAEPAFVFQVKKK